MAKKKQVGAPPKYDRTFRIAIAREYLQSDLGYVRLAAKYGLGATTVRGFVSWYRQTYPDGSDTLIGKSVSGDVVLDTVVDQPGQRQLEAELEEARLKIAGLEMLIEIAQNELGVDIVKKPGTKQSTK